MRATVRGFTLIELMVVVTLAALLLGIGVPSFKGFIASQRVKTAASEFSMAAVHARSEAIKRNGEVGVMAAPGGWKDGWSIKFGAVSLSEQPAYKGLTMSSPNDVTEVVYLASGRLKDQTQVSSLQIAAESGSAVRCVSFELSGLPKSQQGACP